MRRADTLDALVAACLHGERPVVFLTGEAGMGKSTLLRRVKENIRATSGAVTIGAVDCSAPVAGTNVGAVEALAPWIGLMRDLATEESSSQTRTLVADLARAWVKFIPIIGDVIESAAETVSIVRAHRTASAPEPAVSRDHVFHQVVGFFTALAERQRVVLIIDDAHWADDSSVNLLFALARASRGNIVCVVAYRPDDVRTSREGSEHALLHVERELTRYDLCTTIELAPMATADVVMMIGDASQRVDVDALTRRCGGNPLAITGMVAIMPNEGTVDLDAVAIPPSTEAIIDERMRRLAPELLDVLCCAAVEGETFTSAMIGRLTLMQPLHLARLLRLAEQDHAMIRSLGKQHVYRHTEQAYEFNNILVHRALYQRLNSEEQELMHASIAEALEAMVADADPVEHPSVLHRLSAHYAAAGATGKAAHAEVMAAKAAWRLFAEQEVRTLVDRALRRPDISTTDRSTALILRGTVNQFVRDLPNAVDDLLLALAIVEEANDQERSVDVLCRLAACANMDGDPEQMASYANDALHRAEAAGYQRGIATALSAQGIVAETHGRLDEALAAFHRSAEVASDAGDDERLGIALSNIGRIAVVRNDHERALQYFNDAIAALERVHATSSVARGHNNAGIALTNLGRHAEARERYERAVRIHDAIGDVVGGSSLRTNLAQLAYHEQRLDDAASIIEESITMKRRIGDLYGLGIALYTRGIVRAELKNLEAARNDLDESLNIFEQIKEQMMIDEVRRVRDGLPYFER